MATEEFNKKYPIHEDVNNKMKALVEEVTKISDEDHYGRAIWFTYDNEYTLLSIHGTNSNEARKYKESNENVLGYSMKSRSTLKNLELDYRRALRDEEVKKERILKLKNAKEFVNNNKHKLLSELEELKNLYEDVFTEYENKRDLILSKYDAGIVTEYNDETHDIETTTYMRQIPIDVI